MSEEEVRDYIERQLSISSRRSETDIRISINLCGVEIDYTVIDIAQYGEDDDR
jgi:hypothetical protein